jgi:hypothetical protein
MRRGSGFIAVALVPSALEHFSLIWRDWALFACALGLEGVIGTWGREESPSDRRTGQD